MKDDLIRRRAAIDALSQYPFEKVVNCVSIIEELPSAQSEQRWIPCSERLPKYNTPVLLALKQIGKERTIVIGERRTRKSGWYFVDIAAYDPEHKVIAWMPLPEPYMGTRSDTSDRRQNKR